MFALNSISISPKLYFCVYYGLIASKSSRRIPPNFMNNSKEEMLTPENKRLPLSRSPRQLTIQKMFSCCCYRSRIVGYPHSVLPFEIKSERRKNNIINVHVYVFYFLHFSLSFPNFFHVFFCGGARWH